MVISDMNHGKTFLMNVYETSRSFRIVFGGQQLGKEHITHLFFYSDILYSWKAPLMTECLIIHQ